MVREETILRRTWAEIDLDALAHNYHTARELTGNSVKYLGVVKADAYGHGAVPVAKELEMLGADYLAVSSFDEARELRRNGIKMPVLILGHTPPEMVPELLRYNITQTVSAFAKAQEYNEAALSCGSRLRVHIKVDTGMSRLGFLVSDGHFENGVNSIAASCLLNGLEPEGIFTHFAASDSDDLADKAYTCQQFDLFQRVLYALETKGIRFNIRHCTNSGALGRYPKTYFDMVRPGIALYGMGECAPRLGLKPVMSLKSSISTIKIFDSNTPVSYGRTYSSNEKMRIGVLPIGYADGFFRFFSNRVSVQTKNGPAPVRGRICMDMTMVDLTELPDIHVGDAVEIFGTKQTADELAELISTIPYELTCAVSKRVPRLFIREGQVVERSLTIEN